ncbi:MAG: dihydrofolate reductase [Lachnospiraceae bacterium]|nr:dihydrofolate reductase [Lachnospiraceae bacterium]
MNLIACVDEEWGIGYKNELLVRIPSDQKFFRTTTTGKVVVMGRKTLDSFPGGRPLKDRTNIVLTGSKDDNVRDSEIYVHSIEECLELLKQYNTEDVYIIGGSSIYEQFLPYCDTAYITKVDRVFSKDAYFPNLDSNDEWELSVEGEEQTYFDNTFSFNTYKRKK